MEAMRERDKWGIQGATERVRVSRELGDFIEVDVDAENRRIHCNCKEFNLHHACMHLALFQVLQFGIFPSDEHQLDHEQWSLIRSKCIDNLKSLWK